MSRRTTVDLTWYGRSPPNMTRILYRWGLQPLLERFTHKCKIMTFRNGKYNPNFFKWLLTWTTTSGGTGQLIGSIGMDKDFLEDLLAEFLIIQVCAKSTSSATTFTKIRTAWRPSRPAPFSSVGRRNWYRIWNDDVKCWNLFRDRKGFARQRSDSGRWFSGGHGWLW